MVREESLVKVGLRDDQPGESGGGQPGGEQLAGGSSPSGQGHGSRAGGEGMDEKEERDGKEGRKEQCEGGKGSQGGQAGG